MIDNAVVPMTVVLALPVKVVTKSMTLCRESYAGQGSLELRDPFIRGWRSRLVLSTEMTLMLLSLRGLQPDIFPAHATEPMMVCAVNPDRYNQYNHMAAFTSLD